MKLWKLVVVSLFCLSAKSKTQTFQAGITFSPFIVEQDCKPLILQPLKYEGCMYAVKKFEERSK